MNQIVFGEQRINSAKEELIKFIFKINRGSVENN